MIDINEQLYSVKFIFIGDSGVGKTNIIYRYTKGEFLKDYNPTIGVDFSTINLKVNDKIFHLELWDTVGMENFKSIRQNYYKNAACAIIVYDITDIKTFESLDKWIEECQNYSNNDDLLMVLVGNKCDLSSERNVSEKEGKSLKNKYGLRLFYESSALNGYNIDKIFSDCCSEIYKIISNLDEEKELPGITNDTGKYKKEEIDKSLKFSLIQGNENNNNRQNNSCSCCC